MKSLTCLTCWHDSRLEQSLFHLEKLSYSFHHVQIFIKSRWMAPYNQRIFLMMYLYICWSGRDVASIKPNIWERGLGEGLGFGGWHWRDGQRQQVTVPHNLTAKLLHLLRLTRPVKNPSNSCLLENLNTPVACKPFLCIEIWNIYALVWLHANSSFYLVAALILSGVYYEYANELWALWTLLQVMP